MKTGKDGSEKGDLVDKLAMVFLSLVVMCATVTALAQAVIEESLK